MKITELTEGGAAKTAGLRVGDIIIRVGPTKVRSYEDLIAAVTAAKGPVHIEIVNVLTNQRETIWVTPVAGKIGVISVQVDLK
jgi:C-terminal processing protease CtpA/Prc